MKRLQVLIDGKWQYVFCRNPLKRLPIITENKIKAIKGNKESLMYFEKYFGNCTFRCE